MCEQYREREKYFDPVYIEYELHPQSLAINWVFWFLNISFSFFFPPWTWMQATYVHIHSDTYRLNRTCNEKRSFKSSSSSSQRIQKLTIYICVCVSVYVFNHISDLTFWDKRMLSEPAQNIYRETVKIIYIINWPIIRPLSTIQTGK